LLRPKKKRDTVAAIRKKPLFVYPNFSLFLVLIGSFIFLLSYMERYLASVNLSNDAMKANLNFKELLKEYYPLIALLIGVALISTALGPYLTIDTDLEFQTAQGVLHWGYPYINAWGNLFNEPPLGFYTEAAIFYLFGFSMSNGVALVTLFGLACTVMVYLVGKELYNKSTGLFAAAFFALAPWELVLSRSFLIDVQCLLLSLMFLYFGILAIRKDSVTFAGVAGLFFAAALLTKLFAVFMLVPLLLLFLMHRSKNKRQLAGQLGVFTLPAVFSSLLWYQVIVGKGLFYLFQHNDFQDVNFANIPVSYAFIPNFLVNDGLGILFVSAVIFSLVVGLVFYKRLTKKVAVSDLICIVTIVSCLGLVAFLAVNLNLKAPYNSAVKYIYQSLPFFSLVAGSLATKIFSLFKSAIGSNKTMKRLLWVVSIVGLLLCVSTLVVEMATAQTLATTSYLIFRVQPNIDFGYAFHVDSPISQGSIFFVVQFFGFLVVLLGLLWAGKGYIVSFLVKLLS
jgi:4-amino-4-deoxy-L-arabinose transferase-like glycosyltransferase